MFMITKIFSAVVALILLNGCVGTMKIAEEEPSATGRKDTPFYSKPIEEGTSSIRK